MPEEVRSAWSQWGYAKDEFVDNENFPRRLYVRDGRRMAREDIFITTHNHELDYPDIPVEDPILTNLWPLVSNLFILSNKTRDISMANDWVDQDVHSVRRIVKDGHIYDEGFVWNQGPPWKPFLMPYQSIVPKDSECSNLFAPTAPSSTYMGFSLVRLEHTFTTIGQVSAFAAKVAIENGGLSAEKVPYKKLREYLDDAGFTLNVTANGIQQVVYSPPR